MKHQVSDTLAVHYNKMKLSFLIVVSALFTLASVGLFFEDMIYAKVFGLLGFILFGYGMVRSILMFFCKLPALILSPKGITNNANHKSIGRILWRDIENITFQDRGLQRHIALDLKNPKAYMDQASWLSKFILRINARSEQAPMVIGTMILDITYEELKIFLQSYFDNSKS